MSLSLYNTLTRKKDTFRPIDPNNVRMYVCGPTVYDFAHIGNARPIIVFDVLFRLLRHIYGEAHVTYARNITDVDDKINARAAEDYPGKPLNAAIAEVTTKTTRQFHADIAALGVLPPTVEPTCTGHIPEMVAMIEVLIAKGCAYAAEGHVLLDTTAVPDYGKLSGRSLDEMIAGSRVEVAPYKRNPADSVLWKPSTDEQPGWDSPWGRGRPGWHIECSAMAGKHLGSVFDIHGGGIDLVFPHHENEIAQSRCAHGTSAMANVWMHNGFLQVEGEKMSKSLGNFITINELLETDRFGGRSWPGEVLRLAMLMTHYRQPIDWTVDGLDKVCEELNRWAVVIGYKQVHHRLNSMVPPSPGLIDALKDDLNTPNAIAVLRGHFRKAMDGSEDATLDLLVDCEFMGLLRRDKLFVHISGAVASDPALWSLCRAEVASLKVAIANNSPSQLLEIPKRALQKGVELTFMPDGHVSLKGLSSEAKTRERKVKELIAARLAARRAKDFKESDRIRDELGAMGVVLKDAKDAATGEIVTTWEIKR